MTIDVNDDESQNWRRNVDVVADADGNITDTFNLPDWFVAVYTVTATGPVSGTVVTSFTDGNVKVKSSGGLDFNYTVQAFIGSANCTTGGASGTPPTHLADTNGQTSRRTTVTLADCCEHQRERAEWPTATSSAWSNPNGLTITGSTTSRTICVSGFASGTRDLIGNYTVNAALPLSRGITQPSRSTKADRDEHRHVVGRERGRHRHADGVGRHGDEVRHERVRDVELVVRDDGRPSSEPDRHHHGERRDDHVRARRSP